jgi:hypothetical protein
MCDHDAFTPLIDVIPRTNTVANIHILYINFIRFDLLAACPHRKLNEVGSNVDEHQPNLIETTTISERMWAYTPSKGV